MFTTSIARCLPPDPESTAQPDCGRNAQPRCGGQALSSSFDLVAYCIARPAAREAAAATHEKTAIGLHRWQKFNVNVYFLKPFLLSCLKYLC